MSNFKIASFLLETYSGSSGYAQNYTIIGYDDGVQKASVTVDMMTGGTYGSGTGALTYNMSGSSSGTITFTGSAWENIDKVKIQAASTNPTYYWVGLDNIDFAPAVVPNTAPTDISLSSTSVGQSGGVNATVGTLSSTDVDAGDTHTYSLVTGTSNFNISGSSLRANDASSLAAGNYSVRIQTDDGNGGLYQKSFTITVNDDVAPSFQNSTPSVSGTTVSQTTLTIRLNEIGNAYYVVVPNNAGVPSTIQVKAGQNSGGGTALYSGSINVSSASQDFTDMITGLAPGTAYDIYVVAEDDEATPNLQGSPTKVDLTTNAPDSDGDLTASGTVTEPVALNSTVDTQGEAVDLFDFSLTDGGGGDGLPMTISQITVNVGGTSTDIERNNITWRLNGPDASNVTGVYNAGSDAITFSGLSISVADGGGEIYTINAYYNDNTGLTEDHTFILSVDGDTDFTLGSSGTQMGTTTAVTNGSGSTTDITATKLAFTTEPTGSVSGSALTTQPVVTAQDAAGNTDVDFTETITLSETSAGTLSGDVDLAAVNGVATFTDVAYTASSDYEAFVLTANDQDGVGSDLTKGTANAVNCDVVATKLIFTTEPSPTTVARDDETSFSTVPVVSAVDASGIVDTDYRTDIQLAEVNGAGSATLTATGDQDGSGSTVTLAPSSGTATFTNLAITYTPSGGGAETFNLQASSGGLTTTNSAQLTVNLEPAFNDGASTDLVVNEDAGTTSINSLLAITDADAGQTLTWSVSSSPSNGALGGFNTNETSNGGSVTPSGLTYTPSANYHGTDAFDIQVSDGADSQTITVNVTVNPVNDAPVLDNSESPVLAGIDEDPSTNTGTSVADIVVDGSITDADGGAVEAIAVTRVDNTFGSWQYSIDNGGAWNNFSGSTGSPVNIASAARLLDGTLSGGATHKIRFMPDSDYNGTASITFRAWDKSSGSGGATVDATTNGGSTAFSSATDDAFITITAVNDIPAFVGLDATPSFTEGGTSAVLDGDVMVSDKELDGLNAGNGNYANASLTISRNGEVNANDRFSVASGGNLTVAGEPAGGGTIAAGGNVIATIANTGNGQLQLSFANNGTIPTTTLINEVLQAIRYTNSSEDPAASVKLDWTFNDGNSGDIQGAGANPGTVSGSMTVSVTNVNDAPTLTASGGDPTYKEGAAASDLYNAVTANTVENTETTDRFTSLTLTVTNVSDGSAEILRVDGSDVALINGNSVTTAANGLNVMVSLTGSTATVNFSGASLTDAQMQTLVDGMAYRNTSDKPTTASNRVVTITGVADDGGTANGGNNSTALNLQSTISLTAVNDAPVIGNLSGDNIAVQAGGWTTGIDNNGDVTLSNVDSHDYNGGSLTISDNGSNNTAGGNFSVDGTNATAGGDGTIAAGESIAVAGVMVGTVNAVSDGQGGNALEIYFNSANATNSRLQMLIRNIRWSAAAGSGAQTFTLMLNDGDGTADGGDEDVTANFTMILGNKPIIGNLDGDAVDFLVDGPAVTLDAGTAATLIDADSPANLNGGHLSASVSSGAAAAEDVLTLKTSGIVSLAGTTAGSNVSVGGTVLGTLANNIATGNELVVNFNANATLARVQTLLQNLQYANNVSPVSEAARSIIVTVTDNDGLISSGATINVATVANQPPTLTANTSDPTFTEGNPAVGLFGGTTASTTEAGQSFTGLSLKVDNVRDGVDEILNIDGSDVALSDGSTVTTATNNLLVSVGVSEGAATISLSGGAMSTAALQAIVNGISYRNLADDPTTISRLVTLTGLSDDGGTANGGDDTASLSIASTVSLTAVNDAPTLSATATDPTYTDGDAAKLLFNGAAVSAVEARQAITQLDIDVTSLSDGTDEKLTIDGTEFVLMDGPTITTTANNLTVNVTKGRSTAHVSVTAAGMSLATVQTIIDSLRYRNTSYTPSTRSNRDIILKGLTDDGGSANGGADYASFSITSSVKVVDQVRPAPALASSSPSSGGMGIALNGAVHATIDIDVSVVDLSGVTITDGGGGTIGGVNANMTNSTDLAISHNSFEYGKTYTVTIPSGAIANVDGVTNNEITWSFSTIVNNQPTITSSSSVAIDENSTGMVLNVEANDGDGGATDQNITYSIIGGEDKDIFVVDTSNGELSTEARFDFEKPLDQDANNQYEVTLQISDGIRTTSRTFTITVNNINEAPLISGTPPVSVNEDASYSFKPNASDPEGDNLTFSVINKPDWAIFNASTGILEGTPANEDVGTTENVTISVSDGHGHTSALEPYDLMVENINDAPTISAPEDQVIAEDQSSGTLMIKINDPETAVDQLELVAQSDNTDLFPSEAMLLGGSGQARNIILKPSNNRNGEANITLSVSDGSLNAIDTFKVTVTPVNDAPVLSGIPSQEVDEDALYSFTPQAEDIEEDALSFSVDHRPTWLQLNSQTGSLTGTPGNSDVGHYSDIMLIVSDGNGGADSLAFDLTVHAVNDAPVVVSDPNLQQPVYEIAEDDTTSAGVRVADLLKSPDGQALVKDPDSPSVGAALMGINQEYGQWQYNPGNKSWELLPTVSDSSALLLDADTKIRFVPEPDYYGESGVGLKLRAWDGSTGAAGTTGVDVRKAGGSTAFSSAVLSVSRMINPVNDEPTADSLATPDLMKWNIQPEPIQVTGISTGAFNEDQALTLTAWTNNDELIGHVSVAYQQGSDRGEISFELNPDAFGEARLSLRVSDDDGGTLIRNVKIRVGKPMTWRGDLQGLNLSTDDSTRYIPLKGNFTGGTAPYVYDWTNSNPSVLQVSLRADTLDVTPLQAGQTELGFSVEDKAGYLLADTIRVTVEEPLAVGDGPGLPKTFALYQNYPNPFNPTTTIRYDVPKAARVRIHIYNLLGRMVATLVDKQMPAGRYKVSFDGTSLTSGLYLYRITASDFVQVKKLMLVK